MKDVLKPFIQEEGGRFLAADATGTEHCDSLKSGKILSVFFNPLGKIPECIRMWINCAFERADADLVLIPCIDDTCHWVIDEVIPLVRFNILSNLGQWVDP